VEKYAIYWVANGFDPNDPKKTDEFSRISLEKAVQCYRELKNSGEKVLFLAPRSIVKDATGTVILHETLKDEMWLSGIDLSEIKLTDQETTGATTDGLAIAQFVKENSDVQIEIFATCFWTAKYFEVMYGAVAKWIVGRKFDFSPIYYPDQTPNLKSRCLYATLYLVTFIMSLTKPTFKLWYNFLNKAVYKRRLRKFVRTIEK
jgi:hypothetical protein